MWCREQGFLVFDGYDLTKQGNMERMKDEPDCDTPDFLIGALINHFRG